MQVKTTMGHPSLLSDWPSAINPPTTSAGEGVGKGDPRALLVGLWAGQPLRRPVWSSLKNYKRTCLGICPKRTKPVYLHPHAHWAATMARRGSSHVHRWMDGWIKLWCVRACEQWSIFQAHEERSPSAPAQADLQGGLLSEGVGLKRCTPATESVLGT